MRIKMSKKIVGLVLGLVVCVVFPLHTMAEEFTISVKPEIPSNQQGQVKGYFNVQMKPKEKKEYVIQVANKGDKDKIVDIQALDAGTAPDGKIDYTNVNPRLSSAIPTKFTDLVTIKKELKVPANSVEKLKFLIEMPKESQPGIILGSIFILDKGDKESDQEKTKGMAIHNQMGYPVQMMLSMTNEQVPAKLALDKVELRTHNGHPSLAIPLENKNPNIIPDVTVTTEISKKGSGKILVTDEKTDNTIAPYSVFLHHVQLTDKKIKSGTYTARIVAQSEFGKWEWERQFKITTQLAQNLNEGSIQSSLPVWAYWLIALAMFFVLLMSYLIYKVIKLSRKNQDNDKK